MQDVRILGSGQLIELQRRLRRAGEENLRASMQRRIRRAAEPLRNDLQSAVRGLVIRGQGGGGGGGPSPTTRPLRASIADAVRISVRTTGTVGARVWIDKGALPPDMRSMPFHLNKGSWRHPVYGNKRRWVNQYATPSNWWDSTVRGHQSRMRAEVARVLDDVQHRIGG